MTEMVNFPQRIAVAAFAGEDREIIVKCAANGLWTFAVSLTGVNGEPDLLAVAVCQGQLIVADRECLYQAVSHNPTYLRRQEKEA